MAGYQIAFSTHQDWIGEPEGTNATCNLGQLGRTVCAGISCERDDPLDRPVLDLQPSSVGNDPRRFDSSSHQLPTPPPPRISRRIFGVGLVEFTGDFRARPRCIEIRAT